MFIDLLYKLLFMSAMSPALSLAVAAGVYDTALDTTLGRVLKFIDCLQVLHLVVFQIHQ